MSVPKYEAEKPLCLELQLLERVAASTELKRAARLRDLLRYVGRRWEETGHGQISEHEIGEHVFGRHADYDTSHDNIVRVNASELRKRLETYFATEGAQEQLILEIPKGGYSPVFRARPQEPAKEAPSPPTLPLPVSDRLPSNVPAILPRRQRWLPAFCIVVMIALMGACLMLLKQNRDMKRSLYTWKSLATLGPFWSGFLSAHGQTDIVLADSSFSIIEDFLRQQDSLSEYLQHDYLRQIEVSGLPPQIKATLRTMTMRDNTSFGDFQAARHVLGLDPLSSQFRLRFARDYTPAEIRNNNVILIGSSRSNPWVGLFGGQLNFTLALDATRSGVLVVLNREPRSGEVPVYTSIENASTSTGYGIVDYIPNPNHTANVLILAGTTSTGTEAAGEFVTSEESMRRFQSLLHMNKLPHFELLLKTSRLIDTPLSSEIVSYRILP